MSGKDSGKGRHDSPPAINYNVNINAIMQIHMRHECAFKWLSVSFLYKNPNFLNYFFCLEAIEYLPGGLFTIVVLLVGAPIKGRKSTVKTAFRTAVCARLKRRQSFPTLPDVL
ncbi:MAG: hypothetical protein H7Y13_01090 [Sphingobacteriaceae bacterium]|nr:hypothetical protein [Sphingobacteriaceae bacterium]